MSAAYLAVNKATHNANTEVRVPDGSLSPVLNANAITVESGNKTSRVLLISAGRKAIHVRRESGEKVVRFANVAGSFEDSETGLVGDDVVILGNSEFVTLDTVLPVTGTSHVLLTDAPVKVVQKNVRVRAAQSAAPVSMQGRGC